ncbi:hypothetical protein F444_12852 [Phytophthora nicotianae P1976]|uniref:Uncharacterized protein n=1 Tax=Phytophthora nicotianae P1976 TaxID=1317066 RepID=A0A080ZVN1_PHYNI|nr:hypothetical protein F444_12852 [Phytophthora nicotianae P1976]
MYRAAGVEGVADHIICGSSVEEMKRATIGVQLSLVSFSWMSQRMAWMLTLSVHLPWQIQDEETGTGSLFMDHIWIGFTFVSIAKHSIKLSARSVCVGMNRQTSQISRLQVLKLVT